MPQSPMPLRTLAREVLSLPTASFAEQRVIDYVRGFAEARGLDFAQDRAGNAYVTHRRGRAARPLVLTAHMDHPGFLVRSVRGRRLALEFRGGLSGHYGMRERLRLYGDGATTARITAVERTAAAGGRGPGRVAGAVAEIEGDGSARRGDLALWDVDVFRVRGSTVHARQCDDLAGCAAVLATLDRAAAARAPGHLVGLFTRAEEVGLLGAAAAARARRIPPRAIVVAVETSSMEGGRAEQGAGPIVRVGDRRHIFSPGVSLWLTALAERIATEDPSFRFQRKLMDAGTTEATAFDLLGHETGAACVALGNWHNAGPRGRVAAETVHLRDLEGLVRLFERMAREAGGFDRVVRESRRRWARIARESERALAASRGK